MHGDRRLLVDCGEMGVAGGMGAPTDIEASTCRLVDVIVLLNSGLNWPVVAAAREWRQALAVVIGNALYMA